MGGHSLSPVEAEYVRWLAIASCVFSYGLLFFLLYTSFFTQWTKVGGNLHRAVYVAHLPSRTTINAASSATLARSHVALTQGSSAAGGLNTSSALLVPAGNTMERNETIRRWSRNHPSDAAEAAAATLARSGTLPHTSASAMYLQSTDVLDTAAPAPTLRRWWHVSDWIADSVFIQNARRLKEHLSKKTWTLENRTTLLLITATLLAAESTNAVLLTLTHEFPWVSMHPYYLIRTVLFMPIAGLLDLIMSLRVRILCFKSRAARRLLWSIVRAIVLVLVPCSIITMLIVSVETEAANAWDHFLPPAWLLGLTGVFPVAVTLVTLYALQAEFAAHHRRRKRKRAERRLRKWQTQKETAERARSGGGGAATTTSRSANADTAPRSLPTAGRSVSSLASSGHNGGAISSTRHPAHLRIALPAGTPNGTVQPAAFLPRATSSKSVATNAASGSHAQSTVSTQQHPRTSPATTPVYLAVSSVLHLLNVFSLLGWVLYLVLQFRAVPIAPFTRMVLSNLLAISSLALEAGFKVLVRLRASTLGARNRRVRLPFFSTRGGAAHAAGTTTTVVLPQQSTTTGVATAASGLTVTVTATATTCTVSDPSLNSSADAERDRSSGTVDRSSGTESGESQPAADAGEIARPREAGEGEDDDDDDSYNEWRAVVDGDDTDADPTDADPTDAESDADPPPPPLPLSTATSRASS
ncbi:hypothetical protein H9P43_006563 [Blastocladiella emersonii ATCC 22665]|nr:hypothetical protein H9P43_006563 [Blastocladiella emersonii ATCC 22665]